MENILRESENYIISNEYETVFLTIKRTKEKIIIGDFYGDPEAAFISQDECYCVVGGCGLIIYYLKQPFDEYQYSQQTGQWKELFREKDNILWIEEITEGSSKDSIRFTVETFNEVKPDIYEMNVYSLNIVKAE